MNRLLSNVLLASVLAVPAVFGYPRGVHKSRLLQHAGDVDDSYDFIIIGGGTAGLTIADRLTEDGATSVLVIEYGELRNIQTHSNSGTIIDAYCSQLVSHQHRTRRLPRHEFGFYVSDCLGAPSQPT